LGPRDTDTCAVARSDDWSTCGFYMVNIYLTFFTIANTMVLVI
jgi:hypothetical protein